MRSAGPWELTFVTSLVTSVVNSGSKLDAWVTCVNGYRADLSSTRKPDSADLTYSTIPPLSSFLSSLLPPSPPYSIVLCVQSQDTSIVQERWKPKSCLIMSHFQAVIKFSLPYAHTCTTTQRYKLSTQEYATRQTMTSTFQGQISNSHKNQWFWSLFLSFLLLCCARSSFNWLEIFFFFCIFDHISELRPWQSSMTLRNVLYFKARVHESRQDYRWLTHFWEICPQFFS